MSAATTNDHQAEDAAKSAEIARLKEALKATTRTDAPGETAEGVAWEYGGQPESWGGLDGPTGEEVPDESKRAVAYRALRAIYATSKSPRLRREAGEALGYSALRLWLGNLLDRSAAPLL